MDAGTQEWPDQRLKILIPVWTLTVISTAFLVWRVVYGLRSRKFIACDYLLIIATVSLPPVPKIVPTVWNSSLTRVHQALNITATSLNQVVVNNGLGRHIMDPTVFPNLRTYSYHLWITQIVSEFATSRYHLSIANG